MFGWFDGFGESIVDIVINDALKIAEKDKDNVSEEEYEQATRLLRGVRDRRMGIPKKRDSGGLDGEGI